MSKLYIALNGMATSGKNTFAKILNKKYKSYHISIVDIPRDLISKTQYDDKSKSEEYRKVLSDLKINLERYDIPYQDVINRIEDNYNEYDIFIVDMREKKDIERFLTLENSISVFIDNKNVPIITSNIADAQVYDIKYDYTIDNNLTLRDFEKEIDKFIEEVIKKRI